MNTEAIDWDNAPDDATHYNTVNELWYRTTDKRYADIMRSTGEWEESLFENKEIEGDDLHFIPRPVSSEQIEIAAEAGYEMFQQHCETGNILNRSNEPRPPLGLTPKNIWEERMQHRRRQDIHAAMQRYIEAGKEIPNNWLEELLELNNILAKIETAFTEAIQSLSVAKDGGWIEWGKEEEPYIPGNTVVEKVYNDGDTKTGCNSDYAWFGSPGLDGEPFVVTRYRIINEETE